MGVRQGACHKPRLAVDVRHVKQMEGQELNKPNAASVTQMLRRVRRVSPCHGALDSGASSGKPKNYLIDT